MALGGAILLFFQVLLAKLAPVLIMPLKKFVPLGDEHADLAARLVRLAERANTRVKGVYQFDMSRRTKSANAALTGLAGTRRIILGDTLITEFTPDEIEPCWRTSWATTSIATSPLGSPSRRSSPWWVSTWPALRLPGIRDRRPRDRRIFRLPAAVDPGIRAVRLPQPCPRMRTATYRERRADEYALQMTRNGTAFASALTRLANQNLAEIDPEPCEFAVLLPRL